VPNPTQLPLSARELALQALERLFDEQEEGAVGDAAGFDFSWGVVRRHPILGAADQDAENARFALGIVEGDEQAERQGPVKQITFFVTLEFRTLAETDEDPSSLANQVLENVKRRLRFDPKLKNPGPPAESLGGVQWPGVIDVDWIGAAVDPDGFLDRKIEGSVAARIRMKHSTDDPRAVVA